MHAVRRFFVWSAAVLALTGFSVAFAAVPTPVAAPQLNAKCLAVTAPDTVQPGQVFSASVTVQNTSNGVWKAFAFYLGAQNPPLNTRWLLSRLSLFKNVQPGGSNVFQSSQFRAPNQTGTHNFSWQMFTYRNGLRTTWFGETCTKKIKVERPSADLSIVKTSSGSFVKGTDITYYLSVQNNGPSKATNIRVTDPIPSGLVFQPIPGSACSRIGSMVRCSRSSMESGETVVFPLVFNLKNVHCGLKLNNRAQVTSPTYDPNNANNLSSIQNTVLCPVQTGNLYITKSATPVPAHQLLGGTLGDAVLRLKLRAEKEPVDVTMLNFVAEGSGNVIDRLELFKPGETTPFAMATAASCGNSILTNGFCAKMDNHQLVIQSNASNEVLVRPRMKSDVDGGISGANIRVLVPDSDSHKARGVISSNLLVVNDGDNAAEGEIFIGTDVAGPNVVIFGSRNVAVMSKVGSIVNANPDANGTNVPVGIYPVGQFKFTAAQNNNTKNGLNKVTLTDVIFTVSASNVRFAGTGAFKLYNKADPSVKTQCYDLEGTSDQPTFWVACWDAGSSLVNTAIESGSDATFVLEMNIANPAVDPSKASALQVSLEKFSDSSLSGMAWNLSHIRWLDKDNDSSAGEFWWIEYPDTVVKSTAYNGAVAPAPQCSDGLDNDGDGKVDFPADPGCTSPQDDDETDPVVETGDLYVTKSTTPVRSRQLLGGTLNDPVLHLTLHAEKENVDVTKLRFGVTGTATSSDIDYLELYKAGESTPFMTASIAGCGTDSVPANTFCVSMMSQQLMVNSGTSVDVIVRPRMRTDIDGAQSGHEATFTLITGATPAVEALGGSSGNNLSPNDGDSTAEGEVFVGTATPGPNQAVSGNRNVVVLSKVSSITNADPNPNGTSIPTGAQRAISQFKFSTYAHSNFKNGMNKVGLNGVIYSVNASNVLIDGNAFKIYNKADAVTKASCIARNSNGTVMTGSVTGIFSVECSGLLSTAVNTLVDPGTDSTFVLETSVINSKIDNSQMSILQVSLQNFGQIDLTTFGVSTSHIDWQDQDNSSSPTFRWIEYPDTVINGTTYQD